MSFMILFACFQRPACCSVGVCNEWVLPVELGESLYMADVLHAAVAGFAIHGTSL